MESINSTLKGKAKMPYISLKGVELSENDSPGKDEKKRRADKKKKIIRHPIRSRILGILRDGEPRTQREIGKILYMSNAAIHYHVKMLVEVGVIVLHGTRQGPNGITEKLYAADVKHGPAVSEQDLEFYIDYTVSWMNERHRESLGVLKSKADAAPLLAGSYSINAPVEDLIRFKRDVEKIFNDFYLKHHKAEGDDLTTVAMTFSILPSRRDREEETRNILEFEP